MRELDLGLQPPAKSIHDDTSFIHFHPLDLAEFLQFSLLLRHGEDWF